MIDLDVVDRLLGAPPDYPMWRVTDMAIRKEILAAWLSSVVARGMEVSDGAHAYLERHRRRVADLYRRGRRIATHLPKPAAASSRRGPLTGGSHGSAPTAPSGCP